MDCNSPIKRRIYYNVLAESPPENIFSWYFLFVNEPREIEIIKQKIFTELAPIQEQQIMDSGLVYNSGGIWWELFYLESTKKDLHSSKVYNGSWIKERGLYRRKKSFLIDVVKQKGLIN